MNKDSRQKLTKSLLGELNLHRGDHLRAEALLANFADVFSTGDDDQGKTGLVTHRINTQDSMPIRQIPRRLPLAKQAEVND